MRRRFVASTSVRRHVHAGNLPPPPIFWPPNILNLPPPQYSKPSYAYGSTPESVVKSQHGIHERSSIVAAARAT